MKAGVNPEDAICEFKTVGFHNGSPYSYINILHAKTDDHDRRGACYANEVEFNPFNPFYTGIQVNNPHGGYNHSGPSVENNFANKPTQNPIRDKWWNEFPNIVAVQDGLNTYFQQDFKMGEPKLLSKKWSMPAS